MPREPSRRRHCRIAAATKSTPGEDEVVAGRTNASAKSGAPSGVRDGADTSKTTKAAGRDAKKNHGGEMATYLTTMVTAGVWTKQRSDGGSTAAGIDERDRDDRRHDGRTWWRRPRQTTGLDRWPRDRAATAVVSNQSQLSYSRLTTIVLVDSSEEIRQELKETHLICLFSHTHFMFPWMTIFLRTPP